MVVLSQILLHDWWLVKADLDSHGKRLGIGGYILEEDSKTISRIMRISGCHLVDFLTPNMRIFQNLHFLATLNCSVDGVHVCDHFQVGFPYYWEDFAALSVSSEEPGYSSASKGFSA
ncbi:hypothetical protein C2S51_019843 [Perilla frutescens var. frutescens]|nr:hypothetical protein C2S51_019843 [Perilla frutescens var. frutescens]